VSVRKTHLVLIPSYNTGAKLRDTIRAARAAWTPVWVVIDGSTDGSAETAAALAAADPGLRVIVRPANGGKGAAILDGLRAARAASFTHVLTMDADGQHPAQRIAPFMAASKANPRALILGLPVFDETAPWERLAGRRLANRFADLATSFAGIGDCLCGFRVYPIALLAAAMESTRFMRGFDFDPEAAIRLAREGLPVVNLPVEIRYFRANEGGVSHFNYARDNLLLIFMFLRLIAGAAFRLPRLSSPRRAQAGPR
jgi:glycosyltransferase involved in cell wall biosynthesis